MHKIDKLLQEAQGKNEGPLVHFISEGVCNICKGTCKGTTSRRAVVIVDDIPRNYTAKLPESSLFRSSEVVLEDSEPIVLTADERNEQRGKSCKELFGYG